MGDSSSIPIPTSVKLACKLTRIARIAPKSLNPQYYFQLLEVIHTIELMRGCKSWPPFFGGVGEEWRGRGPLSCFRPCLLRAMQKMAAAAMLGPSWARAHGGAALLCSRQPLPPDAQTSTVATKGCAMPEWNVRELILTLYSGLCLFSSRFSTTNKITFWKY